MLGDLFNFVVCLFVLTCAAGRERAYILLILSNGMDSKVFQGSWLNNATSVCILHTVWSMYIAQMITFPSLISAQVASHCQLFESKVAFVCTGYIQTQIDFTWLTQGRHFSPKMLTLLVFSKFFVLYATCSTATVALRNMIFQHSVSGQTLSSRWALPYLLFCSEYLNCMTTKRLKHIHVFGVKIFQFRTSGYRSSSWQGLIVHCVLAILSSLKRYHLWIIPVSAWILFPLWIVWLTVSFSVL